MPAGNLKFITISALILMVDINLTKIYKLTKIKSQTDMNNIAMITSLTKIKDLINHTKDAKTKHATN